MNGYLTDKKLVIAVPYRDRAEHLQIFLEHIKKYFLFDKIDQHIEVKILIIEQNDTRPFNLGILNNVAFLLEEDYLDYICINNVDLLPIWSDFTYSDDATLLIMTGHDRHPIDPFSNNISERSKVLVQPNSNMFHGSVLIPKDVFLKVNGYSNEYWGWGYEDLDMLNRLNSKNYNIIKRRGLYHPLLHKNLGFKISDGEIVRTEINSANNAIFNRKWNEGDSGLDTDGFNQTRFKVTNETVYFNIIRNDKKLYCCKKSIEIENS